MIILLTILLICYTLLYLNGSYNKRYWKNQGIPFNSKNIYLGPMFEFLCSKHSGFQIIQNIYESHPDAPAIGLASFFGRSLLVTDLTNIQHVLSLDFTSFNHRGVQANDGDLLADNIMFNNGNRWKLMRRHMTPLFTSNKLRKMFYIVDKSAKDFIDYLKSHPQVLKGNGYDTLSSFNSAAISAAVFGVESESVFESPFLKMAQKAMSFTTYMNFALVVSNMSPKIAQIFGLNLFKEYEGYFIGAIKKIIRARQREDVKRYDFADICVSLQKKEVLKDLNTGVEIKATDEFLAAQAFFFFLAGVDTSASTMFATLTELGTHAECLAKVHEEIDRIFIKYGGITYDNLKEIEHIDMAINEAARLYPVLGYLSRQCVKDTVLPVGNISIAEGTKIFIPIYAVHRDAKYYPDPEVFKPERFSKENKCKIIDAANMPFGKGNRICMGQRYAHLQLKVGLAYLLRYYTVKTVIEGDEIKYKRKLIQVRLGNVNIEFIPRCGIE